MAWQKKGFTGNFLKWKEGGFHEGIFKGIIQRPSPFKEGATINDIKIEQNGEDNTLSTSSMFLKNDIETLPIGTKIRISMKTKGIKKLYSLEYEG